MKISRRELFIDIVVHKIIFKNSQITLFPCLTNLYTKKGVVFTAYVES